jgi:hypothetical protein
MWLVDNTSLTFEQIAEFCGIHPLEVQGMADGEVAQNIVGMDPVKTGQLTQEELDRAQRDSKRRLHLKSSTLPEPKRRRGPRYTPLSKRHERPDAIAWLVRYHPELSDPQICKLVGTTKPTIAAVRERTHWNSTNIKPRDPVVLGLCKQIELDEAVAAASGRNGQESGAETGIEPPSAETYVNLERYES